MRTVETAEGSVQRHSTAQGCFAWLEQQLETFRVRDTVAAATALPFDFWGGYVGYLGCARCAFTLSMHDVVPVEGWDVAPGNTPHSTFPLEGVGVSGCANTPGWVLRDTARPCFAIPSAVRKAASLTHSRTQHLTTDVLMYGDGKVANRDHLGSCRYLDLCRGVLDLSIIQ